MAINYDAGTDVMTITNEATVTCESIYLADQAGAWGQAEKQGDRQYRFLCKFQFTNSHFKDTNKQIHIDKASTYIYVDTASSFQLGEIDGNGNVYDGCALRITSVPTSMWSSGGAAGDIKLYDCLLDMPGAYFRTYKGTTQVIEVIGCIIQHWAGGRFQGENESCKLKNLYIHDAATYSFGPKGVGQVFDNIRANRSQYGIYYSSPSGGYADGTMYNITARNNTSAFAKMVVGTPGDLYLINTDSDAWTFAWSGTGNTIVYRQNEFDLMVTDTEGNVIVGANVKIWDVDDESHYGTTFSNSVLLDSESFETGPGKWTSSGDLAWTRSNAPTPTGNSGPDAAYDGSWYVYTEASGNGVGYPWKISYLTYDGSLNGSGKVDFWYHKYGIDCDYLELHAYHSGAWHTVWSRPAGSEGNQWIHAIGYYPAGTTNIRFKSRTGDFAYGDTALDLIKVYSGSFQTTGTTTNASGKISTIVLTYGTYTKDDLNTITMKTPHIIEIAKAGYQTYKKKFTLDTKKAMNWEIQLKRISINTDSEVIL